jgi:hypothetical protein
VAEAATYLGAQFSAASRFIAGNSVRDHVSASALAATEPLHETRYWRSRFYAKIRQLLIAQNAFVTAVRLSLLLLCCSLEGRALPPNVSLTNR